MMQSFALADAVNWLGGTVAVGNLEGLKFDGVSTDTRRIASGDVFVALRVRTSTGTIIWLWPRRLEPWLLL